MQKSLYELTLIFITVWTFFLQLYVIFLVQWKSPKHIKEYRYFLNLFTIWDMWFNLLLGLFLDPFPVAPIMAAGCRGISKFFGQRGCMITLSLVFYCATNVMLSQYYCLFYRFSVTHDNVNIHRIFMSKRVKLLYMLGSQIFSITIGLIGYKALVSPSKVPHIIPQQPQYLLKEIYRDEVFVWIDNWELFALGFLVLIIVTLGVGELFALGIVSITLKKLQRNVSLYSEKTYKLHIQFTILLGIQLLIPVIFIVAPVFAALICVFIRQRASNVAVQVGLIWLALYGSINSCLVIFFVSPYRNYTYNNLVLPFLRPCFKKNALLPSLINISQNMPSVSEGLELKTKTNNKTMTQL